MFLLGFFFVSSLKVIPTHHQAAFLLTIWCFYRVYCFSWHHLQLVCMLSLVVRSFLFGQPLDCSFLHQIVNLLSDSSNPLIFVLIHFLVGNYPGL